MADARIRRLNELTVEIQNAERDLPGGQRPARSGAGRGSRGSASARTPGGARLNDAYWARQDYNQLAVAEAQGRLNRAVQERNSLR